MWKCKHCNNEFEYIRTTEKANHGRHCKDNPTRLETYSSLKQAQELRFNNELGNYKNFEVVCDCCGNEFFVNEREKQFPLKEKYYCSRSCSNSVGGKTKAEKYHGDEVAKYRTVALRHHAHQCIVCGFDKIVDIHHIDENHNNNDPKNLVCLCPNHHKMYHHSSYKKDIDPYIKSYIIERWAASDNESTSPLHGEGQGLIPWRSTINNKGYYD